MGGGEEEGKTINTQHARNNEPEGKGCSNISMRILRCAHAARRTSHTGLLIGKEPDDGSSGNKSGSK